MKPGTLLLPRLRSLDNCLHFRVYLHDNPLTSTVCLLTSNGNTLTLSKKFVEEFYEIVPMETEDNSQ
jgi:hypothetical protein